MQQMETELQYCIDQCTKTAQLIRQSANDLIDHRGRLALAEADRHIEMCIHDCLDAKELSKSSSQSMSMSR